MSPLLLAILAVLPSPALEGGTWLPTPGPAGQRAMLAVAAGGDGAVYAVGRGFVYRMQPGEAWTPVGSYVPHITWSADEGFEVTGPYPLTFLQRVEDELTAALESRLGTEEQEGVSEDLLETLVENMAAEPDPRPESAYAVARLATDPAGGVWLGTGGGLFRVSANGVEGPMAALWPILDLAVTNREVVAATPQGLYRFADGKVEQWRQFTAASLARVDGRVAFVTDGVVWWDDGQVGPRALPTPTGQARLIASGGDVLWVTTDLAIYRREGETYTLCPPLIDRPRRLISSGDLVVVVGEQDIYVTDRQCSQWRRHEPPWPGGLRFIDAAISPVGLWGATNEGVFLLGPKDPELSSLTEVEGFKRRLAELPEFDDLYRGALRAHALDPASSSFGRRPMWRMLLPTVQVNVGTFAEREEDLPTFLGGTPVIDTQPPRLGFEVWAMWKINFDFLIPALEVEQEEEATGNDLLDTEGREVVSEEEEAVIEEETPEAQTLEVSDDDAIDLALEDEGLEYDIEAELVGTAFYDSELAEALLEYNQDVQSSHRVQVRKDRSEVFTELKRMYKERLRLMYNAHVTRTLGDDPVEQLRLLELDARLDAMTGGAWTRTTRTNR